LTDFINDAKVEAGGQTMTKSKGLDQWVTFTTSVEQKEWLSKHSEATGIPVSRLIRIAIQALMDKEKVKRKR
jgi:hypothetical protein